MTTAKLRPARPEAVSVKRQSPDARLLRLDGLKALFEPKSVAIVGASSDPTRIGGRPLAYALAAGFDGRIFPVNPARKQIQGIASYPSTSAIPQEIDLAVIAVPAASVIREMDAAAARGARAAIVFSAGFAETGTEGPRQQALLQARCRDLGVTLLGPNCLGVFNAAIGHTATFASFLHQIPARDGNVAIVSQSGAYASYLFSMARDRGIGVGRWIATGNEAGVTIADAIEYLAADPGVRVIACAAEGVRDGVGLIRALETARNAGKPVLMIKMGRTSAGADAAKSHTAALAVEDAVFDAVVRQAGALRVPNTQDLLDTLYALQTRPPLAGRRLGIVSVSGGVGVLMTDDATDAGLEVPPLPATVIEELQHRNPLGSMVNPVDVTAQSLNDMELIEGPIRAMLAAGRYDAVVGFFMNWLESLQTGPRLREALASALADAGDATIALAATGTPEVFADFTRQGLLIFDDPTRAVTTLGRMADIGEMLQRPSPRSAPLDDVPLLAGDEKDEVKAKAILARAGLPAGAELSVPTPADAGRAAAEIGGSVALKLVSRDLPHKTDMGAVCLRLAGAAAVERAALKMLTNVAAHRPDARVGGFLVSPMIDDGIEMIAAVRDDPLFGPVVMVGFGGILVEVLKDVAFAYGIVSEEEVLALLRRLRGFELLTGVRGRPAADIGSLCSAISALSRFGMANAGRFSSVEINPLLVRPEGCGCVMLDALITFPQTKAR